jgi:wyosine [tRNA(Phe)-imidazoG37] synthetase (radical SAM superfamily)
MASAHVARIISLAKRGWARVKRGALAGNAWSRPPASTTPLSNAGHLAAVSPEDFRTVLEKAIRFGRQGKLRVVPEMVWIQATTDCNIRCVMCSSYTKEHLNFTGGDVDALFDSHLHDEENDKAVSFGNLKYVELTSAESLLNKDLLKIIRLIRARSPTTRIINTTNATLPVEGDVKEAILETNYLGISVDGASKETFEDIRRGADFDQVIGNIRAMMQARKAVQYESQDVKLQFVATATNIHEFPALVRLAHDLGVPAIFAQRVEWRPPVKKIYTTEKYDLANLPFEKVQGHLRDAQAEAARLGIDLRLTTELSDWAAGVLAAPPTVHDGTHSIVRFVGREGNRSAFKKQVAGCMVPWMYAPSIKKEPTGFTPSVVCCHMPHWRGDKVGDLEQSPHLRGSGFGALMNSPEYWNIRQGLLDGSLADGACDGCQYVGMAQFQWSEEKKAELRAAVRSIEEKLEVG